MIGRLFFSLCLLLGSSVSIYGLEGSSREFVQVAKPVIVLDAGHGGVDLGAQITFPRSEEKRLALKLTLFTKRYLERLGYRVILTRSRDVSVPLRRRVTIANRAQPEAFVSLHLNSCSNENVQGVEIFFYPSSENKDRQRMSQKLASSILSQMIMRSQAPSRGVRKGDFLVIRETQMASVLVEAGFMTNSEELKKLRSREYLECLSRGIAEGIDRFICG